MKLNKTLGLSVIWLWTLIYNVSAYNVVKIGVEDGLSNNNIVSIAQDKDGFIWICTKDGLNRFDANTFKIFRTSDSNPNSISSNALNFVFADKSDNIVWIATERSGLDAYNYKTNVFTHFEHNYSDDSQNSISENGVTYISNDSKGNLWLATYQGGLDYYDKATGLFHHYNKSNIKGLGSNYNWTLLVYNDETIYAGHVDSGFSILNLKTKTAVNFKHDPENPNSLANNTVTNIFKDSQNNIWIGTRNGLTLFDPVTYQMKNFRNIERNPQSISHNFIQKIIETSDNKLWIGTEGGGINILDLNTFSKNLNPQSIYFKHIQASPTNDGLSSNSVQYLIQDSFGNFWIGGLGGGLNFIPKEEPFFNRISYLPFIGNINSLNDKRASGLCVDPDNNIWVANSSGGICVYDKSNKIKAISKISASENLPCYISVCKDLENNIWIGTDNGQVYIFNYKSKKISIQACSYDLTNKPIYNIFADSKSNIYLSTDYGLYVYYKKSNSWKLYTAENSGLTDNIIRTIAEDSYGNLWVGTFVGGLHVFSSDFKLIFNYGSIYDFFEVNQIYKDSKGRMWVCSKNDLFLFQNYTNDFVQRFSTSDGLYERYIASIIEGASPDEFWLSTTNSISHFDLKSKNFSNFFVSDNITYGDYLNGSVTKTSDGTVYFGSQNGITWFNQEFRRIEDEKILPKTVFTSFLIADNQKSINEFVDIPFSDTMRLKHHQNSFQINFNVLDYSISENIEFAFQMYGLDENWFLLNKDKRVTFRNLKPGNYILRVKERLRNKELTKEFASMHIHIEPPVWQTWWAKLIYLFIFVLGIIIVIRFYKNKLKIENDLLLEKKSRQQEHELNEEKLKFFTNITHELRTPMTLILGPLEDLITDSNIPPEQLKKVNSIHRVASRLLQLINQILEFRKTQNKNRKLRVAKDDIVKYVSEIGSKYRDLNQNQEIEFQLSMPKEKIEMFFDPEVINIILDNLLSNAFKYTRKGHIKLKLKNYLKDNVDYTEITVSDTGYGISPEDLPYIFERYYQAKNATHPIKGTGIGLALVKNLVELHEAEVNVESQLNVGSTFKVKFITNNSYPDVIHLSPGEVQTVQHEQEINTEKVILVVDDNQEIVEYIRDSLLDKYYILTAENGKMGFDIACEKTPDIVISDIMMPVMDGIEMCKLMKQDVRTSHIPVVLLTAKDSTLDQSEGYNAGADSYLTKPFSINLLRSRLTNILETRKKLSSAYVTNFKQKQTFFNESTNQLDKEFIEKLTTIIEKNLEDEEMNISQIASQLNMSHSTLYRKIKALTNLTANEYIRKVRIHYGEQLLLTNQFTISEIMYRIGINSSSYFRQCFKDEFGMNPSEYVQKLREEHR